MAGAVLLAAAEEERLRITANIGTSSTVQRGDSGYVQRPWMMTPILNAASHSPEEFYTMKHVHTHNIVERCIGVLITRWRGLLAHRVMHYAPIKAGKVCLCGFA